MRNNEVKKEYSLRSHLNNKTRNLRSSSFSSLKKKEFEKKNLKNIREKRNNKRLSKEDQSNKVNNKKKLGSNRSPQNKKSLGVINLIPNDNRKKRIPSYSSALASASTSTSTSTSAVASASSSSSSYSLISKKENRVTGKRKFNAELITKNNRNAKNKGKMEAFDNDSDSDIEIIGESYYTNDNDKRKKSRIEKVVDLEISSNVILGDDVNIMTKTKGKKNTRKKSSPKKVNNTTTSFKNNNNFDSKNEILIPSSDSSDDSVIIINDDIPDTVDTPISISSAPIIIDSTAESVSSYHPSSINDSDDNIASPPFFSTPTRRNKTKANIKNKGKKK